MRKLIVSVAALFVLGLPCAFGDKKIRHELQVRAVSYRAFPHENINASTFASCYGAGADSNFWTTLRLNCQTMTAPPPAAAPANFHFIEVYNLVEADGSIYAITCQAGWIGTDCTWLAPGSTFQAEVEDWTMWVTSPRPGGRGKDIRRKFRLLEVRKEPPAAPDSAKAASASNSTPPSSAPAASGDTRLTGTYFGVLRSSPAGISVRFGIAIAEESGPTVSILKAPSLPIRGCVAIHPPLYGSGSIRGTIQGKEISFDAVGPNYVLKFRGELQNLELKGIYAVAPDDDDGAFALQRISSSAPAAGSADKDCLKTLISLDPPGPFSR